MTTQDSDDEGVKLPFLSQGWKKLGFQGTDPSTDVRTGSWPLEQLAPWPKLM